MLVWICDKSGHTLDLSTAPLYKNIAWTTWVTLFIIYLSYLANLCTNKFLDLAKDIWYLCTSNLFYLALNYNPSTKQKLSPSTAYFIEIWLRYVALMIVNFGSGNLLFIRFSFSSRLNRFRGPLNCYRQWENFVSKYLEKHFEDWAFKNCVKRKKTILNTYHTLIPEQVIMDLNCPGLFKGNLVWILPMAAQFNVWQ